jgi:DNA topoisomerase I
MSPMVKTLIIVESPAKARTISRYLGNEYAVESSIGHIRDLPSTAAEIPAKYKREPWARLGVDVDNGFQPLYVVPPSKKAQVKKLKAKLKDAPELYLATDEDREGEAIAWHLVEVLKPGCPVKRLVFHEITRSAIEHALETPRSIDQCLVNAQEARRILDRLVGYEVSPVLWRKLRPKLSAGRVQSVAVRLVVAREEARMRFVEAGYWGIQADLASGRTGDPTVGARLTELDGRRVATGKDFDAETGTVTGTGVVVLNEATASHVRDLLERARFEVDEIVEKPFTNRPYPPFMTSTLQQEAARKLRFNAQRTMRVAQRLYENGYITYMRTDSSSLSGEAVRAARRQVAELYGESFLPEAPRVYRSRSKVAQEAHEAIRPAGETFRTPASLRPVLSSDDFRLYELIWMRTLASQMRDATGLRTTARISAPAGDHGRAVFTASGKVFTFSGFLRAYVEGSDDPEAEVADQEKVLPPLAEGQTLEALHIDAAGHTTQPPARYTEASLVKELEARGIGRPSTYATIIQTIQDRGYVWHKGPALVPTFTALAMVRLLERQLPDLVDYDFTARMEDELDTIAEGDREPGPWLNDFYFGGGNGNDNDNGAHRIMSAGLRALITRASEAVAPREASRIVLGLSEEGEEVAVRIGRYGTFVQVGESDRRATVPERMPPDELTLARALDMVEKAEAGGQLLGTDPASGKPVTLKEGRYGHYVQLGDAGEEEGKPKMASLWPGTSPDELTLEGALELLSYPRELGADPETGETILATYGRFGPYLRRGEDNRSLPDYESLRSITLENAAALFRQPKGSRRRARPSVLAELGSHPESGAEVQVLSGRYGPYVSDGTINASLPKGEDPAAITMERAVELLAARAERMRQQGKDPAKKSRRGTRSTGKRTKKK